MLVESQVEAAEYFYSFILWSIEDIKVLNLHVSLSEGALFNDMYWKFISLCFSCNFNTFEMFESYMEDHTKSTKINYGEMDKT